MKIYIASSFAYQDKKIANERKKKIEEAANLLRNRGFDVYVPHEHTIDHAWDYPNKDWGLMGFAVDIQHLEECDAVVVLSYGRHSTTGTAWEQGYAYARNKKILIVEMNDSIQSIMIANGSNASVKGLIGLKNYDLDRFPYTKTETEQK